MLFRRIKVNREGLDYISFSDGPRSKIRGLAVTLAVTVKVTLLASPFGIALWPTQTATADHPYAYKQDKLPVSVPVSNMKAARPELPIISWEPPEAWKSFHPQIDLRRKPQYNMGLRPWHKKDPLCWKLQKEGLPGFMSSCLPPPLDLRLYTSPEVEPTR